MSIKNFTKNALGKIASRSISKIKIKGQIRDQLDRVIKKPEEAFGKLKDKVQAKLEESARDFLGISKKEFKSKTSKEEAFKQGYTELSGGFTGTRPTAQETKRVMKDVRQIFAQGWREQYSEIRSLYQQADPDYTKRRWHFTKRRHKKEGKPLSRKNAKNKEDARKVKYSTHALETGFFRDSIYWAMLRRTSKYKKHVEVADSAARPGYAVIWDSYDSADGTDEGYTKVFSKFLVNKLNAFNDVGDVVDLPDSAWEEVETKMKWMLEKGYFDHIDDILGDIFTSF